MSKKEDFEALPHDIDAETAVIGSMLVDPLRVIPMIVVEYGLTDHAFYDPKLQILYDIMRKMWENPAHRTAIDEVTIGGQLRQSNLQDEITPTHLRKIVDGVPTSAHAQYYAKLVRDKWIVREAIHQARDMESELRKTSNPEEFLLTCPDKFLRIAMKGRQEEGLDVVANEIKARYQKLYSSTGETIGLSTGIPVLDHMYGGYLPEKLNLLPARPSTGKTSLLDQISDYVAMAGKHVAYFSVDADREEKLTRMACRRAGLSLPKLNSKFARKDQRQYFEDALDELAAFPLSIDDRNRDIEMVAATARLWFQKYNTSYLCVDYLQQYEYFSSGKYLNDKERVTKVSSTLFHLNRELRIPFHVAVQFNRANEKDNRPPKLSDMRDSGTLEQDAFTVLALSKNEEWHEENPEVNEAVTRAVRVEMLKHKFGRTGWKPFWFLCPYFAFEPAEYNWATRSTSYQDIEENERRNDDA